VDRRTTGSVFNWKSEEQSPGAECACASNRRRLAQLGEAISGGSYLSQNDLRIHFGLGLNDRVEKVEVLWPNGKTETLTNLVADRFYTVREGEGVVSFKPAEASRTK